MKSTVYAQSGELLYQGKIQIQLDAHPDQGSVVRRVWLIIENWLVHSKH